MTDSNVSKSVQIAHISILYHALAYSNKDHEGYCTMHAMYGIWIQCVLMNELPDLIKNELK